MRTIDFPLALRIVDNSDLKDEPGAFVWDCALVLLHYLEHRASLERKQLRLLSIAADPVHSGQALL